VQELREMIEMRRDELAGATGHHGAVEKTDVDAAAELDDGADGSDDPSWTPPIVETVAKRGDGLEELLSVLEDHREYLVESGQLEAKARERYAAEIRTLLREDAADLLSEEIDARGGIEAFVDQVVDRETDPYEVADDLLAPIEECVREQR
jgi:LAO/AO transport system kinase